jgi:hypothetical protein
LKKFVFAATAAVMLAGSGASAATLAGEFWSVAPDTIASIDEAIAAVSGGTDPTTATFTSTDIDYGDAGTNWDIGSLSDFLNADAGSIVGGDPYMQESVFRFTGLVSLNFGDIIDVTSDDGFRLFIDGAVLSESVGLRGPNNTTFGNWGGASGTYTATLWYFEGNETQAQLISNLGDFAVVPLPAGAVLMLTALGGFGVMRKRRKS